jgi:P27 family predicted phage terminase small subunit
MPRNVIPIEIKRLRGNPGKRKLHAGPQPPVAAEPPEPLAFLSEGAKAEWRRLAPDLHKIGLLSIFDHMTFGAYCAHTARWIEAERMLERKGLLAKGSTGNVVASPLFRIAILSAREMIAAGAAFGLSPSARARIAAGGYQGPPPDDGKWDGLLA